VKLLLDTCVLSELQKPACVPAVQAFVALTPANGVFVSVITIGEITQGIALLDEGAKKQTLRAWLLGLTRQFEDRILPVDQDTAELWGELSANARRKGHAVPTADGLIAATALRHGLHVATRNIGDFMRAGVMVINPWLTPLGTLP
jgi:predicted nucleic acid-binding protein